jgi:hypothetical protein
MYQSYSDRTCIFSSKMLARLPALLLVLALFLLAGCRAVPVLESSGTTDSQTAASSQTVAATTAATSADATTTAAATTATTADPLATRNMLTGEPLSEGMTGRERPVAVMINNIKVATPQIGIGQADLLYEMQVEGGITRMMAVFADVSAIPELGSVRSARHNYIDLAGGLDAVLVHVGASYLANDQFSAQKSSHIDLQVYGSACWRDEEWKEQRGFEHSVKTNGERLQAALAKAKYSTEVRSGQRSAFLFRAAGDFVPADGPAALEISAPFSDYCVATFRFDAATSLYSKGQFGKPHIDLASGHALQFTNVFLLQTKITSPDSVLKEIDLSKGLGYYISGGHCQAISWRKGKTIDPFVFSDNSGAELMVNTGKSYIGILSNQRTITIGP